MRKTFILLCALAMMAVVLCACNMEEVVPTLPMETITPTPDNQQSAMPTLIPSMPQMTMPMTETQPATSSTSSAAVN